MTQVRFDDLEALGGLISEEFGPFGEPMLISQEMIDQFGRLTGDEQWIHSDVERAAAESPFGGTIAHGFLVLSLLTRLSQTLSDKEGDTKGETGSGISGFGSVINYGADKLRFVSPVPAGSQVHARRRIAHIRKKGPNGTQITFESEIWVVGGERPAMTYRSLALFLP